MTEGAPRAFFSGNSFYTTAANRMARHLLPGAVTARDVVAACGGDMPEEPEEPEDDPQPPPGGGDETETIEKAKSSGVIRAAAAIASFLVMVYTAVHAFPYCKEVLWGGFSDGGFGMAGLAGDDIWRCAILLALFAAAAVVFISAVFHRAPESKVTQTPRDKRKLSKRTLMAAVLILLLIPVTIFVGVFYFGGRKYYFIALLILLETMLPFMMIFESRKPQARELVIIAVLVALGIAGRAAFFMVPQFKPVAAIVIIAGVAFGGESGFLVGALTMLLSNMLYGQGPWSPWQMFAMGIIGFLAGILFRKGWLRRDRLSLAVFGGASVFLIYGGIMNPASVISVQTNVTWPMIAVSWLMGVPFDLIHAAATVFFLCAFAQPMLEKLDRIKVKYGLVE